MEAKVGKHLKLKIIKEQIEPYYEREIKGTILGKQCWKTVGQIFETLSKIFVALGGVVSFSSGYFSYPILGFVAGAISTVSLAMLQFSSFAYNENKKRTDELNVTLSKLNIDTVPEMNMSTNRIDNDIDSNNELNKYKNMINNMKNIIKEGKPITANVLENLINQKFFEDLSETNNSNNSNNSILKSQSYPSLSSPPLSSPHLSSPTVSTQPLISQSLKSHPNSSRLLSSQHISSPPVLFSTTTETQANNLSVSENYGLVGVSNTNGTQGEKGCTQPFSSYESEHSSRTQGRVMNASEQRELVRVIDTNGTREIINLVENTERHDTK